MAELTKFQKKAILVIGRHERGINAAGFAEAMWPEANMHVKSSNGGHGAARGKAAWLCGGSYIGRLRKKGWVRYKNLLNGTWDGYVLTQEGRLLFEQIVKEEENNALE